MRAWSLALRAESLHGGDVLRVMYGSFSGRGSPQPILEAVLPPTFYEYLDYDVLLRIIK